MSDIVILKVDNRENFKSKFIDCNDTNIIFENLSHGDFIIEVNNSPIVLIERKTLQDLTASIKDKRWQNQKITLTATYNKSIIYYLIEGSFDYNESVDVYINGISKKAIISSIMNTMVRDNIKIIFTKNTQDSFDFICGLFKRITKDPKKYIYHPDPPNKELTMDENNCNYNIEKDIEVLKYTKDINKEICFINQLCQIPDISKKTAKAISIFFENSSKIFYERLLDKNDEEKLKVLKNIYIEDDSNSINKRKRRISEKVVKNIINLMF